MSDTPIISDRGKELIKKYLLGGASIGAGTALATSLINYLSVLNKKDTTDDDDTLYVYKDVPEEDREKKAGIEGGIAMAAAPLGAVGAYAIIKKIYTELRKKQAQEELDEAQRAFVETQGFKTTKKNKEQEKNASAVEEAAAEGKPMSMMENITSLPFAIPALLALGSGVISYKMLNNYFPTAKPKVKGPKRIEIIDKPEPEEDEAEVGATGDELINKNASAADIDAGEFLLRMCACEKRASSDLANVVASVALYGATPFMDAVQNAGYEGALNMVKGASANYIHPFKEHIATCYLAKSARLRDLITLTAAAEFAEAHPTMLKAAAAMSEEKREAMYKIASIFGAAFRAEISSDFGIQAPESGNLTKAALADEIFSELADTVANRVDNDDSSDTSGEEAGLNDPDSPSRNKKRKIKFILNGTSSKRVMDGLPSEDIIDQILDPEPSDA